MYADWKNHPVTQELMLEFQGNMESHIATMINRKFPEPDQDQYIRAYVKVATEVIEFEPKIVESDELKEVTDVED